MCQVLKRSLSIPLTLPALLEPERSRQTFSQKRASRGCQKLELRSTAKLSCTTFADVSSSVPRDRSSPTASESLFFTHVFFSLLGHVVKNLMPMLLTTCRPRVPPREEPRRGLLYMQHLKTGSVVSTGRQPAGANSYRQRKSASTSVQSSDTSGCRYVNFSVQLNGMSKMTIFKIVVSAS